MPKILLCLLIFYTPAVFAQDGWEVVGRMPYPVYGGEAVVMDSLILVIGGTQTLPGNIDRPLPTGLIQAYNPRQNTWRILDSLKVPRYGFAVDTLGQNQLIICGGSWQDDQSTYTIEKWQFGNQLNGGSEVIYQNSICNRVYFTGHIYRNRFYLFGGVGSPTTDVANRIPDLIIFDLMNNREYFNSDSSGRKNVLPYHHASVRIGNTVYIIGGVLNGITNTVRAFNLDQTSLQDLTLTIAGTMGTARAGCRAVVVPGYISVIGGYTERAGALASVDLIALDDFKVHSGPAMQFARREFMAVLFENAVYVLGGWNQNDALVSAIERLEIAYAIPVNIEDSGVNGAIPGRFVLGQNFPNPFNNSTVIPVQLSAPASVRLDIFSVTGQQIRTLHTGMLAAGAHRFSWDACDEHRNPVSSGTYFIRVSGPAGSRIGKMILMR